MAIVIWYLIERACFSLISAFSRRGKGLRHTVATTLRKAGMEERQIADLLGQKTPAMARHYSRSANLAERNRLTLEVLEKENERRSETVKPLKKSVKP
ncbi:hypothetical protein [Rhodovulum sp. YEN HP10]|uniref:hypothetical protein n=1 Tax=Rhodovulum sp. HP10 TaxID=3387397 RepID=UPI0039E123B1